MKRLVPTTLIVAAVISLTMQAGSASAENTRMEYPDDINGPPFFAFPVYEPDQEWTPIIFYRDPSVVPLDINLFNLQFGAWGFELLADGFVIFGDQGPFHQVLHGIDMPIWFVPTVDFESVLTFDGDGNPEFFLGDLQGIDTVRMGTATQFVETSQYLGGANVPFAEVQSKGVLDGGGSFSIHLSEAWLPPDGEHNIFHYEIVVE